MKSVATRSLALVLLAGGASCTDTPSSPSTVDARLAMTSNITSGLVVTPLNLEFGATAIQQVSAPQAILISNAGNVDLTWDYFLLDPLVYTTDSTMSVQFTMPSGFFDNVCNTMTPLGPGKSCKQYYIFTPIDAGPQTGIVKIKTKEAGAVWVTLTGTGATTTAKIGVAPSSLAFGSQNVGSTSAAQKVTISNTGAGDLTFYAFGTSGGNASDFAPVLDGSPTCRTATPLVAGASCDLFVTFTPSNGGARSASLDVQSSGGTSSVSLAGTGVKLAAVLSAAPTSLTFGSQLVGSTSTVQKVTVKNTGTADLTLNAATVTGANPKDFRLTPYSNTLCLEYSLIAPGASCELVVEFTPTAAGARAASLDIQTDAGNAAVALAGTGLQPAPVLSVSPTSLAFGTQDVGTPSAVRQLTISNTGTGPLSLVVLNATGANATDFVVASSASFSTTGGTSGGPCYEVVRIEAGANCIAYITFTPSAAGPRVATLGITSDGGTASVALTGTGVLPPADVSVSLAATPSPATAGKPLTYTITVRNVGPNAAKDVRLIDVIPSTTSFVSISAPPELACATPAVGGTGTVSCLSTKSLAAGGTYTVTLVVKVLSGGRNAISNTVTVSAESPDPVSANNAATVATTVYGRK